MLQCLICGKLIYTLYIHQLFIFILCIGLHAGWAIEGAVGSLQKVQIPLLNFFEFLLHLKMNCSVSVRSTQPICLPT